MGYAFAFGNGAIGHSGQGKRYGPASLITMTRTKAELLMEAHALETMGGEWLPAHAAAFCNVSTSFLRRSSCPKRFKKLAGITDKHAVVYLPAVVRNWNAARTLEDVA